ncbi:LysR family transcriptional regulator [Youngiibacter fragilis]|nr:LysR family transcriptional regulator [Youngiibacter fragilis]
MTYSQVHYFLMIESSRSFSHAAEELFISQSSLSKQIKALEDELGVQLFIRTSSKVELTSAGNHFLEFAKKSRSDYLELIDKLSMMDTQKVCSVKVGTLPLLAPYRLLGKIARFQETNDNIHLDLLEREQQEIIYLIDNYMLDLAIARTDYLDTDKYDVMPLIDDDLAVACSLSSPLAKLGKVKLSQLKDEKFILLDQKSTIHRLCIDACRKSGFSPNVKFTISRHEPLLAMVELGLGITLFPRRLLMDEPGLRLAIVELEVPVVSGVAIIRRKDKKMSLGAERFFNTFPTA